MKVLILDLSNAHEKFVINGKKDEDVKVITTYMSCDIWFHTSGINYHHEVQKKLKSLFDKVNES